jgi:hypothetical protein
MKRIDWIVLIAFIVILVSAGIWYFFFRKKPSKSVIPPPPVGGMAGSGAINSGGATSTTNDVSDLPYGSLPLKIGDKNQMVAVLQRALNYLGAYLTVDGIFGPQTQSALLQRTGSTIVTTETALVLANQINGQNDGSDPIADYIIEFLK